MPLLANWAQHRVRRAAPSVGDSGDDGFVESKPRRFFVAAEGQPRQRALWSAHFSDGTPPLQGR
jgi:hypothetical protein